MKARVKATGHIVDVELSHYLDNVAWYITKCHASYSENELEFIDEPQDYWTRLEHQAAIAAMQGILSNAHIAFKDIKVDTVTDVYVDNIIKIARTLVEKYKKEERK